MKKIIRYMQDQGEPIFLGANLDSTVGPWCVVDMFL